MRQVITLIFCIVFTSCQHRQKVATAESETPMGVYQANDFTVEGLFTSGIEGPAVDMDGNIYAVNFAREGTIGKVSREGTASLFVDLPSGSTGNGIRVGPDGDLFIADYTGHNVLRILKDDRTIQVFAHNGDMNQPNDLAISDSGTLFASDPNWQESTGNLWRINKDGSTKLLESNMGTTNGIEISPDNRTLYVNESVQRNVWAYDLDPDFGITGKRLLHRFEDYGMDGMRCDSVGNLYITRHGKGTVAILSPGGQLIREVVLKGQKPSNIAFGGKDGRTCYVTLQDRGNFEYFQSEYPGRSWVLLHRKMN